MLEHDRPSKKYSNANPLIHEEVFQHAISMQENPEARGRLLIVHPDLRPVEYTLVAIRHNLLPPLDAEFYNAGLETFLLARDLELGQPTTPYPLAEAAIEYTHELLGTNKSYAHASETRKLAESILKSYKKNADEIPRIDPAPFGKRTIPELRVRTKALVNSFPHTQPLVTSLLEHEFYGQGRHSEEQKLKRKSMTRGIIDANGIFKSVEDREFEKKFGKSANRFRSFMNG